MKRVKNLLAAVAVVLALLAPAHALWDSTTGSIQDTQQICWGQNRSVCAYGSGASNYLRFQTNSVDQVAITNTGLGIGTNSPTNALSVTGNANFTGSVAFGTSLSSYAIVNATGSYTMTTLGVCIATITLTTPANISTITVQFTGASSSTVLGSTMTVGILVNGAFATVAGVAETSARGLLSVGNGNATGGIGGNDLNLHFGPYPIGNLAVSTTYNICLALASGSGTYTIDNVNEIAVFSAEYRP